MTAFDERVAALSPEKRALFEQLLAAQNQPEVFGIAVIQRGLWFIEQLRPDNPAHVVPGAVRIHGALDVGVLKSAVDEIVRRHEALRTTFGTHDGKPAQIVHPHTGFTIDETDFRDHPISAEGLDKVIAEELARPFDITKAPLIRVRLMHVAAEESVLVLAMHHLISDRWSMGVFLNELSALYAAYSAGEPSPLADLPIQYGDFAAWQQQRSEEGTWAEDLTYWRERLTGAPVLDLPTDRPRPSVQGYDGGSVPLELPKPLMQELEALARKHGATTYMALLTVFKVLLHRYTGAGDLVVGAPIAVRDGAETEPLIGYFVNTLAVRTDLTGDPGFTGVLSRVRDACLGAYAHQEVPFDLVVAELNVERDLSRPPVYQVSFSYGREPANSVSLGGAALERLAVRSAGSRFDLELQTFDAGNGLSGWIDYDRALYDEPTVAAMARHFAHLVQQIVAAPEKPISDLALMDDAERERMIEGWTDTTREWPDQGLIHECFEEHARRHPDAEALKFGDESVSYAELDRRANQLAHRLRRHGVGRDQLVGVALERSIELVVSLMAVLKAGGAYVPMDPDYPPARLEYMLGDANAPVLLTDRQVLERLPSTDAEVLCVAEIAGELAAESAESPGVEVDSEDLAYMIYTSGSTGQPKGVQNVHGAIRSRLLWMQDTYGLDGTDRVLQKTPISFDVSVWEFFWPLLSGATLVLARPGGHKDSGYLLDLIKAENVTTMHFVPAMLRLFLTEKIEEATSLRRVICSGEELPRDAHDRFLARSKAGLHNLYGPTEAAIDVTSWECRPGGAGVVPIGHPVANTRILILDERQRPLPAGIPGELHIGGRNLARGYLNRPELTAEKFIEDPFHHGERLYRTGDLARFRHDGAIEFLGRLDHQVKVRGFRIELGEVESVLAKHEGVGEAVVVAREQRLVAYVKPSAAGLPATQALIAHTKAWLPEHMVPSAFVELAEFPLSPSGKVDRKALPEPDDARPDLAGFVAPAEGLERQVAQLWCATLGLEQVGSQDNFFDLGGHSLLMAELRSALAELGHDLSMVELFGHPTVGSLAGYLAKRGEAAEDSNLGDRAEHRLQSRDRRRRAAGKRSRSRIER